MNWVYLFIAGVFEVGWALGLKYADGFSKPGPTAITIVFYVLSLGFLGLALRGLPLGTAYAVWTGIGTVGTAILGIVLFDDPVNVARTASIAMIVVGVLSLKIAS